MAQSLEPGGFSSLHNDLVAGRPMELDALHGFVVRRAAERGVPVAVSEGGRHPRAVGGPQPAQRRLTRPDGRELPEELADSDVSSRPAASGSCRLITWCSW